MKRLLLTALVPACALDAPAPSVAETTQQASVCADGTTTFGIDVSRFQGDIDWQQVAGANVKFAWIQISRSLTDIDAKFPYNWQHAKDNGILRGAYQRFQPGQDVIGQATLFLEKLGPFQPGDLPPALDVEDANGLTPTQIAAAVKQWIDYVEPRVGVKPVIYTGYYFWRDSVGSADFSSYPLWIANYSATCPLVPDHWAKWTLHQYSSTVTLPGITANTVDVDKFNGTIDDLKALGTVPPPDDTPCQVIGEGADAIVDDASACFHAGGDPAYIRTANAGYGSSLQWTMATDATTAGNFGRWDLYFGEGGRYRVEAFTPAPYNGSKRAVYQVQHGDALDRAPVDQSAVDGWNVIGEFDFVAGGNGQYIRVDDNTGEPESTSTKLVFDALRFTRITDMPGDTGSGGDDPGSSGGCSTSTPSLWLFVAVILLRRRRADIS